jgi:hypothetical protein
MRHKDKLSDEEAKARRLESAQKYREANREKTREACRLSQAKRREDPEVRAKEIWTPFRPPHATGAGRLKCGQQHAVAVPIVQFEQGRKTPS